MSLFLALSFVVLWEEVSTQLDHSCAMEGSQELNGVMYKGRCRDPYADGVCGDGALGERLALLPDGEVGCDCDEGWLKHEGRCYQEFTTAFCDEGKILNLGTYRRIRDGQAFNCLRNPCGETQFPHSMTWFNRYCHDVSDIEDPNQCELFPANKDIDGSSLKCCSPADRSSCSGSLFIQSTSVIFGSRKCRRGQIWSRYKKKCIKVYG